MPSRRRYFWAVLAALCCALTANTAVPAPSFVNDIEPILTRQGCNQGSCHGKGAGQNGFRLSLRGYAPENDWRWLTRELDGRRIDTSVPGNSLLLRKPTGSAPHEGGKLFDTSSREYKVLLEWVAAGAPGPNHADPKLVKLELRPAKAVMTAGAELPLKAIGEFSDGSESDVTWLTRFDANDPGLVAVSPGGTIKALRHGETAVRASFLSEVAVAIVTTPYAARVDPDRFTARNNFVDDAVFAKLKSLGIEPANLCTDEEFVRRAFIDVISSLPTPREVRGFLADQNPNKRRLLIDALLERPEFVDSWTLQWSDLLQNRKERDHDVRGTKGVRSFHVWIRQQVAANRPWDEFARAVLTAQGTTADNPAIGYFIVTVGENREAESSEVVGAAAQTFLGIRIGCAQCHNHPLERYTQDDYYRFAGFFSRIAFDRKDSKLGATGLRVGCVNPDREKGPVGAQNPRTGEFLKARPLDRSDVSIAAGEDPRAVLAAWITDPRNEYFSGAMVNRICKHYLGAGLVEPVDDLRATNPPSNPDLWQALNREFVEHRFDLKHLMRVILNSRTYQLSSGTTAANESDVRFYSHYYARRLPAETLLDAISQCTGVPDHFAGYPLGMRAVQLPDPALNSYFLTLFGRSQRVTACACERNGEVTMPQLLHMQNGEIIVQRIAAADSRLSKLLKEQMDDNAIMDDLFLAAFARPPTDNERQTVRRSLADGSPRDEVFRDLCWALLNSKEFSFNH